METLQRSCCVSNRPLPCLFNIFNWLPLSVFNGFGELTLFVIEILESSPGVYPHTRALYGKYSLVYFRLG